jgi:hypothetical protein
MASYVAWLGQLGTIKAARLQPYLSAINGFFKDHGFEAVALGDLVAAIRKGLATSHAAIDDTPVRVHLPYSIVFQVLRVAKAVRLQLAESTTRAALTTTPSRNQVRLMWTCTSLVLLYLFFSIGGSGIDYLTDDLSAFMIDGILLYHRKRRGQRGVLVDRKPLRNL